MSIQTSHIPFCIGDCRTTKNGPPSPADIDYVKLDVLHSSDGSVGVIVPYTVIALMGEGPFKIFLAAARHQATLSWTETDDSMPPLVVRFFHMLFDDLKMISAPWFEHDLQRQFITVHGMTSRRRDIEREAWNERRRQRRVAISAGHWDDPCLSAPRVSATQHRMIEEELRRRHGFLVQDTIP